MVDLVGARLYALQPASSEPADPLPVAERGAYQRQLLEAFLVSRRAIVGRDAVHHTLSALRANFLPWLETRGLYAWDVTPEDLDDGSVPSSVGFRTDGFLASRLGGLQ